MFYGWVIVFVAGLVQALSVGSMSYSYGVIIVPLAEEFEASRFSMMLGTTCAMMIQGLLSPILGAQLDKRSVRHLMLGGAFLLGGGMIALSFVQSIWQFIFIYGACFSFSTFLLGPIPGSALVTRWFERKRGRALGTLALGISFGGFFVPQEIQFLINHYGWRTALLIHGILILMLIVIPIMAFLKNYPAEKGLSADGQIDSETQRDFAKAAVPLQTAGLIARHPEFWMIATAMGILMAVYAALLTNMVPYAVGRGIDKTSAAQLMAAIAGFGIIGKLAFGYAMDRVGLRLGLWAAQLLVVLCLMLLISAQDYQTMVLAAVCAGLATGGLTPVWAAMMANVFGVANFGRAMGLMTLVTMPLMMLGPMGAGKIYDITGAYTLAFQLFIGTLILAALALVPLRLKTRGLPALV